MSVSIDAVPSEETQAGLFSSNKHGCLTILRNEPVNGYVSISFTPNDETTTADLDVQTLLVPETLFDSALELAGYSAKPVTGRSRRS